MTENNLHQDFEEPQAEDTEATSDMAPEKPAKPPIGKAGLETEAEPAKPQPIELPKPTNGRSNGQSRPVAEAVSTGREALLTLEEILRTRKSSGSSSAPEVRPAATSTP